MIFLVRHGEAAAGWGDHPDPGLSDLGRSQAEAVSNELAERGATHVVSSPMLRCRETAVPFARHIGQVPTIVPEVSEIETPPDVTDRVSWLRNVMSGNWPEAGPELVRWRDKMGSRVAALPDQTVVFSHFVAINALVGLFEADSRVTVFRPGHCSITKLKRDAGGLRVAEYGSEASTRVL